MLHISPGCYIVAVSGGVDSMALLDMLRQQPGLRLVVAHADHGIRPDSHKDRQLVEQYAAAHGLRFEYVKLKLSQNTSENTARQARYRFLRQCSRKYNARAITTAHHQDDLIETAVIALIRGTGWRGLAPFAHGTDIVRPLLDTPKHVLIGYARKHNLPWREDVTNTDPRYLRNYIRLNLVPLFDQKDDEWRRDFLQLIRKQQLLRRKIDHEANNWLATHACSKHSAKFKRYDFIMLPRLGAYEVFQQLCRRYIGNSLERPLAEQAIIFIKTAHPGKRMPLNKNWQLCVTTKHLIVEPHDPMLSYNKQ